MNLAQHLFTFPDLDALRAGLACVLDHHEGIRGELMIIQREPSAYATSFPCEIVTCRLGNGKELQLFCKYSAGEGSCSHGQRGGVGYEAGVYREVLAPSGFSVPTFHGAYSDPATGDTWLILEYLDGCLRAQKVPELQAVLSAARWIAQFHAANERRVSTGETSCLTVYDAEYYIGWPRRASRFADLRRHSLPWLLDLCRYFERDLVSLAELPQTVIHGEYYPHNIMFRYGKILPIDWETAAVGPGEIDLATLGDGWPPEVNRRFEAEYVQTRWPSGAPPDFRRNLDLAQAYVHLRWLGDRDTKVDDVVRWKELTILAKNLGGLQ